MSNVKVILGKECASQHRRLVGDFRVSIPSQPKHKFVPRIRVWKLRDPEKQAELSEVFKAKTLHSELTSGWCVWSGCEMQGKMGTARSLVLEWVFIRALC